MKHIFIINPAAGQVDRSVQLKSLVEEVFGSHGLDYDIQISKGPGDCTRLARAAAETGEEVKLYACGGDGTLNEVVNGVVGFENATITHYPSGSGNDFVKIFNHPEYFRDLERFLDTEESTFDLIRCEAGDKVQYSCNICSMGLDARIGTEMSRYRRLPGVSGKGAYYISTVANLLKGIHKPYILDLNGETITGDQTLICVCNGRNYGGSFNPVPDAEPDDGILNVLVIKPVNLLQVAAVIGKYQQGQYDQYPHLIRSFHTTTIRVQCTEESVVNVDGEAMGSQDVTFTVVPRSLRFFYPAGLTYRARRSEEAPAAAL